VCRSGPTLDRPQPSRIHLIPVVINQLSKVDGELAEPNRIQYLTQKHGLFILDNEPIAPVTGSSERGYAMEFKGCHFEEVVGAVVAICQLCFLLEGE
jgi:hypothetical protein